MFRLDVGAAVLASLVTREENDAAGSFCVSLKHGFALPHR